MRSKNKLFALAAISTLLLHATYAAPRPQNDIDSGTGMAHGQVLDYNTVVGHFKDFVMYLPVMMTTLRETMTGFPKFAEGIRILTSKNGRLGDDDCKCSKDSGNSNEIENSSNYG